MNDPQKLWNKCLNEMKEIMKEQNEIVIPDLFKAEDFDWPPQQKAERAGRLGIMYCHMITPAEAAHIANARFREWAGGLKKVYAQKPDGVSELWSCTDRQRIDTHVALLAFPQEIKKAECAHEPVSYSKGADMSYERLRWILANTAECKKCGEKLKAKWETVE